MKSTYSILCVIGVVLPLSQFAPWLHQNGLNIPLFVSEAFGNRIAAFAWLDVLISAVVVLFFIIWEGRRLGMTNLWMPVVGLFSVGVSFGLPLFLLLRETHLSAAKKSIDQKIA